MKNKKGFTLIELLAVIVILAIIALIAIPIVLNMIESARKAAARDTAYGYIDAIEYNNGFANVEVEGYSLITGTKNVSEISVKMKGKAPDSGSVTIDATGKVSNASLCIGKYKVDYNGKEATVEKSNDCSGSSHTIAYKEFEVGDKVYFNPVSYAFCNEDDTSASCYEWIVISKNNDTYELYMLDNVESMLWNGAKPNPVDMISSYTGSWSNKLTVDSTYDYTFASDWKFEFSSGKARMLERSEYDSFSSAIQNELKQSCNTALNNPGKYCAITNNTENYVGQINPGGAVNTVPYTAKSALGNNYVKPVIKIDIKDGVGNATAIAYEKYDPNDEVYFDPVSNNKCDSSSFSVANVSNGTSTCYKWRVISVNDKATNTKVTLQLDHSLFIESSWSTRSNAYGPEKILQTMADLTYNWNNVPKLDYQYNTTNALNGYGILTCTEGICTASANNNTVAGTSTKPLRARAITMEELLALVNTVADNNAPSRTWSQSSRDTTAQVYYISTPKYKIGYGSMSSGGNTTLKWLLENTIGTNVNSQPCDSESTDNVYGSNSEGYWTLTPDTADNYATDRAFMISGYGYVATTAFGGNYDIGVRPVITIEKSKLK